MNTKRLGLALLLAASPLKTLIDIAGVAQNEWRGDSHPARSGTPCINGARVTRATRPRPFLFSGSRAGRSRSPTPPTFGRRVFAGFEERPHHGTVDVAVNQSRPHRDQRNRQRHSRCLSRSEEIALPPGRWVGTVGTASPSG